MPLTKSAHKALRSSRRKKVFNDRVRNKLSETVKTTVKKPTSENLKNAYQTIDRAAGRGVIHSNRAKRLKSRLARLTPKKKVLPKREKSKSSKT